MRTVAAGRQTLDLGGRVGYLSAAMVHSAGQQSEDPSSSEPFSGLSREL